MLHRLKNVISIADSSTPKGLHTVSQQEVVARVSYLLESSSL